MKVLFIANPKYLANEVLSFVSEALQRHGDVCGVYLETHEQQDKRIPFTAFKMVYTLNEELVTAACSGISLVKPIVTMQNIYKLRRHVYDTLDKIKPDAIVHTSDMGGVVTRMAKEWARKNGVLVFVMQPCFINMRPVKLYERFDRLWRYIVINKILRLPLCRRQSWYGCENKDDILLLWSDTQAHTNKVSSDKAVFVGNPALDVFAYSKVHMRVLDPPVALICTQPYEKLISMGILTKNDADYLNNMIKKVIIQNPDIHFIVKVHPNDKISKYVEMLGADENCKNYEIIKTKMPFREIAKEADMQISVLSYTSFECVLQGIPIILLCPGLMEYADNFKGEVELRADNIFELNKAIRKLMLPEVRNEFALNRMRFIKKHLYFFGNSANYTANVIIQKILENRRKE